MTHYESAHQALLTHSLNNINTELLACLMDKKQCQQAYHKTGHVT